MSEIDPVKFGQMVAEVETLKREVAGMSNDIKELLALANKSKGGFWMGMAIASSFGGLCGWIVSHMPWAMNAGR